VSTSLDTAGPRPVYLSPMKTGILLLGFGEPAAAEPVDLVEYLERIFLGNAGLDPSSDPGAVRSRARAMAESRAPELLEDYRRIGGSPLNAQAARQAELLNAELERMGHDVLVAAAMQFTEPSIPARVEQARAEGVDRLIALPVYPLAGPSTTMPALEAVRRSVDTIGWAVHLHQVTGWHPHPAYTALRADGVRAVCERERLALDDQGTRLVFAAHGTPIQYLEAGSRYDRYVDDHCRRLAHALGAERYLVGFQNHSNRPTVLWTQPDIHDAVRQLEANAIVVVPISFMQEQSETLAELDHDLRATATAAGLDFHRVPVPYDDARFIAMLADLVAPLMGGDGSAAFRYVPCRCRPVDGAVCLDPDREDVR
jgi:protoporphyrin/coproporphyrin ferrochelatase